MSARRLVLEESHPDGSRSATWAWSDGTIETTHVSGVPFARPAFTLSPPTEERAVNGEPEPPRRGRWGSL